MRLLLWLSILCCAARAAATPESDALISEGVELRRKQRDAEALDRFRRALAIEASPRARAQIGFAEQALGRWAAAERDLQSALGAREDPWIIKNRAAIERALGVLGEHLGTLELTGAPEGATITVGGERVGTLPLPDGLRLPVGTAPVGLAADGYTSVERTVVIAAGKISRERIELQRPESPQPLELSSKPLPMRPHQPALWIGGWSLLGVGAALAVAAGGGGAAIYQSSASRWNADSCVGAGLSRGETCGAERDRAMLGQRLEISGFVLGGAMAVAGVAMLAADAARRRSAR